MAGSSALRFIQLGRESTFGTEVNATTIWRGPAASLADGRVRELPDENIGVAPGGTRSVEVSRRGTLSMPSTPVTFEQIGHIFDASGPVETATQDGEGTDYIYEWLLPTTAKPTIKSYTIETGDDQQEEQGLGGFVTAYTIGGQAGGTLNLSRCEWVTKSVAKGTKTASVAIPTVEDVAFSNATLHIDAGGGTIGTTQKSNTLMAAEIAVTTGLAPSFSADDLEYFGYVLNDDALEATVNITFLHDSTAVAEKDAWRLGTTRLIQLKWESPTQFGTPGTTYSVPTLIFQCAGIWRTFEVIGVQDGNDIVTGTLEARYSSADSLYAKWINAVALSALP